MQCLKKAVVCPIHPFDFKLSCGIYTRFERITHTAYMNGVLYKCYEEEGVPLLLAISEAAENLNVCLYGQKFTTPPEEVARWLIAADLDLSPFYDKEDRVMSKLVKKLFGLKPPRARTVFEALIIAITEQQIGLNVAAVFQNRLVERYGKKVQNNGMTFFAFPQPEALSRLDPIRLREIGLSRNKGIFITEISKRVSSGELDLEAMKSMPTDEAREALLSIKGVGRWTADYVLIRGLGRVEMVPYDDLGIRDAVGMFYGGGERVTAEVAEGILSRFDPLAGLAAYYLIFARFQSI